MLKLYAPYILAVIIGLVIATLIDGAINHDKEEY
jgi:hypothetical protein